jgi:hypothetical protein
MAWRTQWRSQEVFSGLGLTEANSAALDEQGRTGEMRSVRFKILSVVMLLVSSWSAAAQEGLSVGTRGGVSFDGGQNRFWQAETFADLNLPRQWNFCSDWRILPRLDASAGWLDGDHADSFVGTLGPLLELHKGKFPLVLEGGSSPTILSRDRFGAKSFGERFQFTSHIGLTWNITAHIAVAYRFQHMSNAGIAQPNPGLNLQMLELSYSF